MKQIILEALESAWNDGKDIDDASDIPKELRPKIIKAWRDTASKADINEAYLGGEDDNDMATLLAFALDEVLTHEGQKAMMNCFWTGMSWEVDKAIMEAKQDRAESIAIAREERAEQWADWQRDRLEGVK